jgi:CBS domain-containing protein
MALVRDAMIQVAPIRATDPIFLALQEMRERRLSFLPVTREDGTLYGLVTEGDLIRLIYRATRGADASVPRWLQGAGRELLAVQSVREVITREVETISPDATLEEAAERMLRNHRKVLPVVESGKPVGYLTRSAIIDMLLGL